ncbi:hypothetical protein [Aneurinibacillus aneurinilyticus]|uniref:Uncharacterized protein n=1 Tax=Aneurinibacillus aneurinilyticus ATCC 12856 TaxID=649747 RepID=U1YGI8_ANEAE|nr:hypothetical protein [Aneurinibacillus aneurinilyticus]ERI11197.1 hypothetical protein HMPREF0083_00702 [Aneurinibacillus aneurinilyticus ATCC 12856]MED0709356.1 hypothetical protein [Aneurinibacillus aneurinilyticus]MED0726426.1 hypothetical protein [Aneurinibacillus aneurinilyticus]MED0735394.1 hypothetical protein [Aneurinibacillus aneurinilyticus]MED0742152.1 hypothetical protein [Aneurinibacillus aneurinilyticus]
MKKKIKLSILSALMCLGVSSIAQAAEPTDSLKNIDRSDVVASFKEDLKKKHPNLVIKEVTNEEAAKLRAEAKEHENQQSSSIGTYGPAKPVTDLYILGIVWDGGASHQAIDGQISTSKPIKGLSQVVTFEEGNGSDTQWLGDEQITFSNPDYIWKTDSVDYDGDRIVDAWIHYVTFDSDVKIPSQETKQYRFQSRSYNAPWNTEQAWLNIPHQ